MTCRILHVTGGYPEFLHRMAEGIPEGERTFDRLLAAFVDSRLGWSDYWVQGFRASGHEAEMVVCNSRLMQEAWAAEHGLAYDEPHWAAQILLGQLKAWKPDVVWVQDLYFVSAEVRRAIRSLLPDAVLMGWRFSVTRDMEQLRDLDVMITGADAFAEEFRRNGIPAETVPLFFPEAILDQVAPVPERSLPFTFCGTVGQPESWHSLRHRAIEKLLSQTPLEVYGGEVAAPPPRGARSWLLKNKWLAWRRHRLSLKAIHPDRFHDAVFGLDYFRLLANTQLCFNAHIDMAVGFAGNMRLFEAPGMGACLLTDWKPNLSEFLEPDREVAAYRTPEEAVEKANYLLAHPTEREAMAESGRRRVLRDHTLAARLGQVNGIIEQAVRRKRNSR